MPLGDGDRQSAIECALQKGYLQFAEELLNPTKRCISTYHAGRAHPEAIETMFDVWYSHLGEPLVAAAMCGLAKSGTLELMQQLYQLYSPLEAHQEIWKQAWRCALGSACESGNLSTLQWLLEHPLGREECEYMKSNRGSRGRSLFDTAAAQGHVGILQDEGLQSWHGLLSAKLSVEVTSKPLNG
ncbi:unnamed protein product [Phytophthora lilii]|uniref:Unnamed protein product n=1 Tax=Phytophthora lilii TaxID=2077276 RepID=A0A9W6X136_9STRA|nr:unnamed protein product [Phytophthora lilii]